MKRTERRISPAAMLLQPASARAANDRPSHQRRSGTKGASRWNIAARVMAAIPANYLLTSIATACLARLLPLPAAEASVAATLFSFALFALVALTAFGMRSVARLWLGMIVAAAALGSGLWLSIELGGRL